MGRTHKAKDTPPKIAIASPQQGGQVRSYVNKLHERQTTGQRRRNLAHVELVLLEKDGHVELIGNEIDPEPVVLNTERKRRNNVFTRLRKRLFDKKQREQKEADETSGASGDAAEVTCLQRVARVCINCFQRCLCPCLRRRRTQSPEFFEAHKSALVEAHTSALAEDNVDVEKPPVISHYECGICWDIRFPSKKECLCHLEEEHSNINYLCHACSRVFRSNSNPHLCKAQSSFFVRFDLTTGEEGDAAEKNLAKYMEYAESKYCLEITKKVLKPALKKGDSLKSEKIKKHVTIITPKNSQQVFVNNNQDSTEVDEQELGEMLQAALAFDDTLSLDSTNTILSCDGAEVRSSDKITQLSLDILILEQEVEAADSRSRQEQYDVAHSMSALDTTSVDSYDTANTDTLSFASVNTCMSDEGADVRPSDKMTQMALGVPILEQEVEAADIRSRQEQAEMVHAPSDASSVDSYHTTALSVFDTSSPVSCEENETDDGADIRSSGNMAQLDLDIINQEGEVEESRPRQDHAEMGRAMLASDTSSFDSYHSSELDEGANIRPSGKMTRLALDLVNLEQDDEVTESSFQGEHAEMDHAMSAFDNSSLGNYESSEPDEDACIKLSVDMTQFAYDLLNSEQELEEADSRSSQKQAEMVEDMPALDNSPLDTNATSEPVEEAAIQLSDEMAQLAFDLLNSEYELDDAEMIEGMSELDNSSLQIHDTGELFEGADVRPSGKRTRLALDLLNLEQEFEAADSRLKRGQNEMKRESFSRTGVQRCEEKQYTDDAQKPVAEQVQYHTSIVKPEVEAVGTLDVGINKATSASHKISLIETSELEGPIIVQEQREELMFGTKDVPLLAPSLEMKSVPLLTKATARTPSLERESVPLPTTATARTRSLERKSVPLLTTATARAPSLERKSVPLPTTETARAPSLERKSVPLLTTATARTPNLERKSVPLPTTETARAPSLERKSVPLLTTATARTPTLEWRTSSPNTNTSEHGRNEKQGHVGRAQKMEYFTTIDSSKHGSKTDEKIVKVDARKDTHKQPNCKETHAEERGAMTKTKAKDDTTKQDSRVSTPSAGTSKDVSSENQANGWIELVPDKEVTADDKQVNEQTVVKAKPEHTILAELIPITAIQERDMSASVVNAIEEQREAGNRIQAEVGQNQGIKSEEANMESKEEKPEEDVLLVNKSKPATLPERSGKSEDVGKKDNVGTASKPNNRRSSLPDCTLPSQKASDRSFPLPERRFSMYEAVAKKPADKLSKEKNSKAAMIDDVGTASKRNRRSSSLPDSVLRSKKAIDRDFPVPERRFSMYDAVAKKPARKLSTTHSKLVVKTPQSTVSVSGTKSKVGGKQETKIATQPKKPVSGTTAKLGMKKQTQLSTQSTVTVNGPNATPAAESQMLKVAQATPGTSSMTESLSDTVTRDNTTHLGPLDEVDESVQAEQKTHRKSNDNVSTSVPTKNIDESKSQEQQRTSLQGKTLNREEKWVETWSEDGAKWKKVTVLQRYKKAPND